MGTKVKQVYIPNNSKPTILDADFLTREGVTTISVRRGENYKIIGNIDLESLNVAEGGKISGEGITVHELNAKKHSCVFIKEADIVKARDCEVRLQQLNERAKIRRHAIVSEDDYVFTQDDATVWSGSTAPSIAKGAVWVGALAATVLLGKPKENLPSTALYGTVFSAGAFFVNDKIDDYYDGHFTVKKTKD